MKTIINMFLLLLCFSTITVAQKKEADEKYRLYNYDKAIPLYVHYLKDNPTDDEAWLKLATSYKITSQAKEAIEAYKQLVILNKARANDYFDLVQLLQTTQNLDEAKTYAKTYQELAPGNKANTLLESLKEYDKLMSNFSAYNIINKTDKYNYSVSGTAFYEDKIIVSAESKNNDVNKWTGGNYLDLFITDNSFAELDKYAPQIMEKLDDAYPTFSADGKIMYYTAVNENSIKEGNINTKNLHILMSVLENGKWQKPISLPFNSNAYSTAHPTINKAGNKLIFSSNKPGGKGGSDLYLSELNGNTWSNPINISKLNTWGNEVFPVFISDDVISFSSNGLVGLGGLDIYKSTITGNSFSTPENLKAPINSSLDDFELITNDDFQTGYLSSNRMGNPQEDDILYFEKAIKKTELPVVKAGKKGLKIIVKDKYTATPLPYVSVSIKDDKGNEIHKGLSDEEGLVIVDEIECGDYKIQGTLNEVTTTIAKVTSADCETKGDFIEKEILHNDPRFTLRGIVKDANTNKPLEGVKVTCKNETNGITKTITTKADGKFFFQLEQKSNFSVVGEKPKWLSSERAETTTEGLDRTTEIYVDLSLKMYEPVANAVIRLKNIFYDLNKADIKPKSEVELNSLVKLMNDYPDMKIELASHTDCRNTNEYNQSLSQRRSESAVAYLVSKGIDASRIIAKGYGESKLINRCADGVKCSEEEHQENRRTEFMILECSSCPQIGK